MQLKKLISNAINDILSIVEHLPSIDYDFIISQSENDLKAFAQKDPSSNKDEIYILKSYLTYFATISYRVANYLHLKNEKINARKISENAKLRTGIEIHPNAKIGKRFVIDHGIGTVIGETTIIGDDCYILQNVILGSSKITNNLSEPRHPIIGNNVEIGSNVRIYGKITIGDNVKISPNSIIRDSIPSDSIVILNSNYQIIKQNKG